VYQTRQAVLAPVSEIVTAVLAREGDGIDDCQSVVTLIASKDYRDGVNKIVME
jgi:hypothetical protein